MSRHTQGDQELVQAALADREAFSAIVEKYEPKLRRYVRRITRVSEETIDDLLQETFIKIFMNLAGVDPKLSFQAWVYRIAHNVVRSHYRKTQSRPEGHTIDVPDEVQQQIESDFATEALAEHRIQAEHIQWALAHLSDKYREVIVLRYFEQKDYTEIADILQKPIGSVGTLLHRAHKKLQQLLEQRI